MVITAVVAAIAATASLGLIISTQRAGNKGNATVEENRKRGPGGWSQDELARFLPRTQPPPLAVSPRDLRGVDTGAGGAETAWNDPAPISGYTTYDSIQRGFPLQLHLRSTVGALDLRIARQGWYGGNGQLDYLSVNNVAASAQPIPVPDTGTGLIAAAWPLTYQVLDTSSWPSGMYVVRMTRTGTTSPAYYVPFVVRDEGRASDVLMAIPLATYQAYNAWGGKSLYDYNSGNARSHKVSFDRPYDANNGLGLYYGGDYQLIRFLEREGYDVSYATSSDLESNANLLSGHKAFVSAFHDEYWSWNMRDALERGRDRGSGVAFLASNNIYWQVRWESATTGVPRRVIVSYKNAQLDPVTASNPSRSTVLWRDPLVGRPENGFLGSMFDTTLGYGQAVPWVVTNASSWVYAGTGLQNGQSIANLIGYEFDRLYANGAAPTNVEVLTASPVVRPELFINSVAHATIYQAPSGAWVFNAGTNYWPMFLEGSFLSAGQPDERVRQMTRNVINRMVGSANPPPPTTPPSSVAPPTTAPVTAPSLPAVGPRPIAPAAPIAVAPPPRGVAPQAPGGPPGGTGRGSASASG